MCDLSIHLGQIGTRMFEFWVEQFLDKFPFIGEEKRTFAVVVEPPGSIYTRGESKFIESAMTCLWGELAEYAKWLVEKNNHGY